MLKNDWKMLCVYGKSKFSFKNFECILFFQNNIVDLRFDVKSNIVFANYKATFKDLQKKN